MGMIELGWEISTALDKLADCGKLREFSNAINIPYSTLKKYRSGDIERINRKRYGQLMNAISGPFIKSEFLELLRYDEIKDTNSVFMAIQDRLKTGLRLHQHLVEKCFYSKQFMHHLLQKVYGLQANPEPRPGQVVFEPLENPESDIVIRVTPFPKDGGFMRDEFIVRDSNERIETVDGFLIDYRRIEDVMLGAGMTIYELRLFSRALDVFPRDILVLNEETIEQIKPNSDFADQDVIEELFGFFEINKNDILVKHLQ